MPAGYDGLGERYWRSQRMDVRAHKADRPRPGVKARRRRKAAAKRATR